MHCITNLKTGKKLKLKSNFGMKLDFLFYSLNKNPHEVKKMLFRISDLFNINTIHNVKCSKYILKILASREYFFS